jgi:putative hydrolase of the HAD superfamily
VGAAPVLLWDFDGTLARRRGLWSGCIIEVLDEQAPGHTGTLEQVRAAMHGRYPWSRHEEPHPHLCEPELWWAALLQPLARAIEACGVEGAQARELARQVRARFTDGTRAWELFPDSRAALERAAGAGLRNVILSNHVPELERLVAQLGLAGLIERVFSSACTGYEKPHPEAFLHALRECGQPARRWMVGDNPIADGAGAGALGIPVVLIRGDATPQGDGELGALTRAPDAAAAVERILACPPRQSSAPSGSSYRAVRGC